MKTLLLMLVFLLTGCFNQTKIHSQVESALVFEQQVHAQVSNLKAVFDVAIVMLPADKQAEYRQKLAASYDVLTKALDAKDQALQAALAASAETVDVSAAVQAIVVAVQDIIAIVAAVGANPLFIQNEQQKARSLTVLR